MPEDTSLDSLLADLGIPGDYAAGRGLPNFAEADSLVSAGPNILGREQMLEPATAGQWVGMRQAAAAEGVDLLLVSGYRSFSYQAALVRNKLERGMVLEDVLKVVAVPGCSEHHTGRAVDIATPGVPPLVEEFEQTAAFAWLERNAKDHGFSMSYPRENGYGYVYEPWHWCRKAG